jgi:hypothetical protein
MDDRLVEYMEWYERTVKIVLLIYAIIAALAVGAYFIGRWIIILATAGIVV